MRDAAVTEVGVVFQVIHVFVDLSELFLVEALFVDGLSRGFFQLVPLFLQSGCHFVLFLRFTVK